MGDNYTMCRESSQQSGADPAGGGSGGSEPLPNDNEQKRQYSSLFTNKLQSQSGITGWEGGITRQEGGKTSREGGMTSWEGNITNREGGITSQEGGITKRSALKLETDPF